MRTRPMRRKLVGRQDYRKDSAGAPAGGSALLPPYSPAIENGRATLAVLPEAASVTVSRIS